ncbi:TPA: restriction endonuclease subunit S [Acinetobacter baumannii]|uniref:Type I restriction endonuclease subunit S n=1 Tax=Acinetobacter baumannii TaxID=470 RepID=A0AAX0TZ18_ACIBA|nr:type I restriction endonuclease subunit S [Acinetobacter baumannii]HAW6995547.1 restriction endonuclease subunit S [Acinetobacter baumannii]HAW6999860.1 restriction endonuclease subunit S [Acinetobacter baumannii]HAW7003304.1 restriction endonuclease subunit S [Acinetobacter baumannii]HAW7008482.1 restriction endonuclease subunit S [Acinetobacter baumannii]
MAKYQKYTEYKESGVEWLGEIPSHWEMWKLAHAYSEIGSGTTPSTTNEENFEGDIPWVTTGELRENTIFDTKKKVSKKTLELYPTLKKYPVGSVAIAMYGATIGRLGIFGVEATTNQACCVMTISKVLNNDYLFYWLQAFKDEIVQLSSGGGQPNINQEKVASLRISAPNVKDQTQIANFLDHETTKIDHLIEKQQQLIELLKEKRQAVISHAVTKGLNPNVPMKNSGVEWLGEVPEHWVIPRLKQLIKYGSSISYGIVQPGDALDEGIPFIQTTNISKGSFELQDFQKTSVAIESNYPRSRLEGGEVILGIRASIGAAFVVPMSFKGVNLSRGIARIIPNALLKSDFLVWYFKSNAVDQYWGLSKQGSTFSEVSIETVRELSVVVPPIDEQEKISEFLSFELGKLERLISSAENQKLLLLERRTALISAAVTGKIDIRNWQAPSVIEADTELSA